MRHYLLKVAGIATLTFAAGCEVVRGCTLIGCVNGLVVRMSTQPTLPFRVEIQSPFGSTNTYECASTTSCSDFAIFQDYFPESATIKVITVAGTTTTAVTPEYKESQPNGEGCGPTCRQANVTVPFPGG